ncbi:MAG TPA: metalloregulator ArsR/SmtB family transcription factor [Myxococcota bacterium]|nr:metalloregulator ArsR/SmtB family transcription factor [Myxococcota bacterium]
MPASLQKIFRTLGDPTRLRILALLEREELAVQELMEVLGMAQSRVSRHLGILREARLLRDRRDGTFVLYRFEPPADAAWRDALALARRAVAEDPAARRDAAALARVLEARSAKSRSFFEQVGPEWDAIRKVWGDELLRARALHRLVRPRLRVLDLGTGTGALAQELAAAGCDVIAVDHSPRMLAAAREKLAAAGASSVELRTGDAAELPLADAEVDAAFAHMVLQYLPSPPDAIAEMARVTKPGGTVVAVDFAKHERAWMRDELGVVWMGFAESELARWLEAAGLRDVRVDAQPPAARGADLPATFIASGVKPSQPIQRKVRA